MPLSNQPNWIVWRHEHGRKVPYSPHSGCRASTTDPTDWSSREVAERALERGGLDGPYTGLGYTFSEDDPLCGVDLDNCRDPETGRVADWAQEIIDAAGTYTEVSPSGTGVKLYGRGELPGGKGRQVDYHGGKVEMYDRGRYFAYTGQQIGAIAEARDLQPFVNEWHGRLFDNAREKEEGRTDELDVVDVPGAVLESLKAMIDARCEDAVEGCRGSDKTIHMLCEVRRQKLNAEQSQELIHWVNDHKCLPPWPAGELERKWEDAKRMTGVTLACEDFEVWRGHDPLATGGRFAKGAQPKVLLPLMSAGEFDRAEFPINYIVDNVLVEKYSFLLAGMFKTCKTSFGLDLAVSAASRTPFLGHFETVRRTNTIFFSGESGGPTLQRKFRRLLEDRRLSPDSLSDHLAICLRNPKVYRPDYRDALCEAIERHEAKLILIDPAYLSVVPPGGNNDTASVDKMGSHLEKLDEIAQPYGATIALLHHFSRGSSRKDGVLGKGEWPGLGMVAGAGYAEYARHWLVLGRTEPYAGNGRHLLRAAIDGSMGHSGRYEIEIDEGYAGGKVLGRWDVVVDDATMGPDDRKTTAAEDFSDVLGRIRAGVERLYAGDQKVTQKKLQSEKCCDNNRLKEMLDKAVEHGLIEAYEAKAANNHLTTYYRPSLPF